MVFTWSSWAPNAMYKQARKRIVTLVDVTNLEYLGSLAAAR